MDYTEQIKQLEQILEDLSSQIQYDDGSERKELLKEYAKYYAMLSEARDRQAEYNAAMNIEVKKPFAKCWSKFCKWFGRPEIFGAVLTSAAGIASGAILASINNKAADTRADKLAATAYALEKDGKLTTDTSRVMMRQYEQAVKK